MPLLYRHLDAIDRAAVSEIDLGHLRERFHSRARRNLQLTAELLELLKILRYHGIAAVPFKGPVLADSVYGDISLRQFGDLDIVVQKRDVSAAKEILLSRGYCSRDRLNGTQEAASLHYHSEHKFLQHQRSIGVELHWELAPRFFCFPLKVEHLWNRLQPLPFAGQTVLGFPASDLLLILCMHGSKHCWQRLAWITDVAEMIDRYSDEINWPAILEQSRTLGCERMLYLGMFLAEDLLGATLPEDVSTKIRAEPSIRSLAANVRASIVLPESTSPALRDLLFHVRVRERLQDKVRYCFRQASTPTAAEWELVSLPQRLTPLYHLIRPMRVVVKHGPAFIAYLWRCSTGVNLAAKGIGAR